jgi:hypothetical protein
MDKKNKETVRNRTTVFCNKIATQCFASKLIPTHKFITLINSKCKKTNATRVTPVDRAHCHSYMDLHCTCMYVHTHIVNCTVWEVDYLFILIWIILYEAGNCFCLKSIALNLIWILRETHTNYTTFIHHIMSWSERFAHDTSGHSIIRLFLDTLWFQLHPCQVLLCPMHFCLVSVQL